MSLENTLCVVLIKAHLSAVNYGTSKPQKKVLVQANMKKTYLFISL